MAMQVVQGVCLQGATRISVFRFELKWTPPIDPGSQAATVGCDVAGALLGGGGGGAFGAKDEQRGCTALQAACSAATW